jgi:hypothetical protein
MKLKIQPAGEPARRQEWRPHKNELKLLTRELKR